MKLRPSPSPNEVGGLGRLTDGQLMVLLQGQPDNVEARVTLGRRYLDARRVRDAEAELRRALETEPESYDALFWLAIICRSEGRFNEAIALIQRALVISSDAAGYNALGLCYLSARLPEAALSAFESAQKLDPASGPTYHNIGLALRLLERRFEALEAFRRALTLDPGHVNNYVELYNQCQRMALWQDGIEVIEAGLTRHRNSMPLILALANACSVTKQTERAESLYRKALKLDSSALHIYGMWLQEQGWFEESRAHLQTAIEKRPGLGVAYFGLTEAKCFEVASGSLLERALVVHRDPSLTQMDQMYFAYAIARAYERQKEFEPSMRYFDRANELAFRAYNEGRAFDNAQADAAVEENLAFYNEDLLASLRPFGSSSQRPIFIVGMIRSGTTLLDQIVSSHPSVRSAGELVYWQIEAERIAAKWQNGVEPTDLAELAANYELLLEATAGPSERVTDKMPLNYDHLGLIHATFPRAKIIHIRRNPIDTCLSIYATHFGSGPNFAYRKDNIVAFYRRYLRIMDHWRAILPSDSFLEVDYESLVAEREAETRRLIDFCDLTWDDACLHHERNDSAINTPSRWQARQPIYRTSIERWRPFEPWLGEFLSLRDTFHPTPGSAT
jgi:tetratricopeptide (TPR) repeat protein